MVHFEHPSKAIQTIAMFDEQSLCDRFMQVKMDKGTVLYRDC